MPLIERDVPWTRQPQVSYPSNPRFAPDDLIMGSDFNGERLVSPVGLFPSLGLQISSKRLWTPNANVSELTLFAYGMVRSAGVRNDITSSFASLSEVSAQDDAYLGILPYYGNTQINAFVATADYNRIGLSASIPFSSGTPFCSFLTYKRNSTEGLELWINNTRVAVTSTPDLNLFAYSGYQSLNTSRSQGYTPVFTSVVAAVWKRRLSDADRALIVINPWQLFAPRTQRFAVSSAATTPTLGTPTFVPGSLSASGFRPRFPVTWG